MMIKGLIDKFRIVSFKTVSIFASHGRNRNGEFSFLYLLKYSLSNIRFRLFFKYLIQVLSVFFNSEFALLKKIANVKLTKSNIVVLPLLSVDEFNLDTLSFKKTSSPKVSIIICVYNNISFTYNCLLSIVKHVSENVAFEVVLVNDASTDKSGRIFSQIPNMHIVNNAHNMGFVISCNVGAANAKGEYLCFLNNDTIVQENWLESMLHAIESDNKIGIVGSKLIFPDGDLQEAGGVVWKDGQTHHYGRRGDMKKAKYNYMREVDYCSGASFLIRKNDFTLLNGFDLLYSPGYYEDTDLCFSVKHVLNKKIIYQPESVVVHYEGITAGTSLLFGMKRFQRINAIKFRNKWERQLSNQLPNSFANLKGTVIKYHYELNAKAK